ncbi:hypothetical protein [Rhizobium oryzicola]|uniref:Tetratricopeptide repeat protein n=1 Tax=Rhizobium oryzicola TaxID=1232668 RepID=A0ABT8SUN6_9HYPH|nr:hypothetical protein [Rhizobium oryzicola]MDO1582005.1 hypothetical protein [Rhizobium oryzicola]
MRFLRFGLLILPVLVLAADMAAAQTAAPLPPAPTPSPAQPAVTASAKVTTDKLFEALKRERDPDKAKGIASQIASNWTDSGSATVNLLMQWANKAITDKKNAAALDFLDRVTLLEPAYTEAWNRRATLHYTMGNPRKSMADIEQVLRREPRYFPAIAGMATILTENGQDELALKAWERYLSVYPADREAQEQVTKLSEKLAGSRT